MNIEAIQENYLNLRQELRRALATMEKSNKIILIRDAIKDLQNICPHDNGNYDFSNSEECPYCGKHFKE